MLVRLKSPSTLMRYVIKDFLLCKTIGSATILFCIPVFFFLLENGVMEVFALDKTTGCEKRMEITNDDGHLSKNEVERMKIAVERYIVWVICRSGLTVILSCQSPFYVLLKNTEQIDRIIL